MQKSIDSSVTKKTTGKGRSKSADGVMTPKQAIARYNDHYAYSVVKVGSQVRVMQSRKVDGELRTEFFKANELKVFHANEKVKVMAKNKQGEPVAKLKCAFSYWLEHPDRRFYNSVVFKPCQTVPTGDYNLWQGFTVTPAPGDWTLLREHLLKVIANHNVAMFDYLLNWLAYSFQHADRQQGTAVILRGDKGTGKSILGNFITSIWGVHGLQISRAKHLVGNFNKHLWHTCFLFADEAYFAGDRKEEGALKSLITEPELTIEAKGVDVQRQKNYLKILMATNSDWAVPASRDERRWAVYDVSPDMRGNFQYFGELATHCNNTSVKAAFLHDMLHRDITTFKPSQVVESSGLKEQRLHSLDSVGQFLHEALIQGFFLLEARDDDGHFKRHELWEERLQTSVLFESYRQFCDRSKRDQFNRKTLDSFSKYLNKIFPSQGCRVDHKRAINFGSIDYARAMFATHEKVDFEGSVMDYADDLNPITEPF